MSCRCGDIRRCNNDISKLYRIRGKAQGTRYKRSELNEDSFRIWHMEEEAYELKEEIKSVIQGKIVFYREESEEAILNYISYLDMKISNLEDELNDMEDEDETYHEEEDRDIWIG